MTPLASTVVLAGSPENFGMAITIPDLILSSLSLELTRTRSCCLTLYFFRILAMLSFFLTLYVVTLLIVGIPSSSVSRRP